MLGWRDGGRTRWWQWPAQLASAALQRVNTAAALEDMDKLISMPTRTGDLAGPAAPAQRVPLDPTP
jgi:hypothetical protein